MTSSREGLSDQNKSTNSFGKVIILLGRKEISNLRVSKGAIIFDISNLKCDISINKNT